MSGAPKDAGRIGRTVILTTYNEIGAQSETSRGGESAMAGDTTRNNKPKPRLVRIRKVPRGACRPYMEAREMAAEDALDVVACGWVRGNYACFAADDAAEGEEVFDGKSDVLDGAKMTASARRRLSCTTTEVVTQAVALITAACSICCSTW